MLAPKSVGQFVVKLSPFFYSFNFYRLMRFLSFFLIIQLNPDECTKLWLCKAAASYKQMASRHYKQQRHNKCCLQLINKIENSGKLFLHLCCLTAPFADTFATVRGTNNLSSSQFQLRIDKITPNEQCLGSANCNPPVEPTFESHFTLITNWETSQNQVKEFLSPFPLPNSQFSHSLTVPTGFSTTTITTNNSRYSICNTRLAGLRIILCIALYLQLCGPFEVALLCQCYHQCSCFSFYCCRCFCTTNHNNNPSRHIKEKPQTEKPFCTSIEPVDS